MGLYIKSVILLYLVLPVLGDGEKGDWPPPGWVAAGDDVEAAANTLAQIGEDKIPFINKLISQVRNGHPERLGIAVATLKAGIGLQHVPLAQVMEEEDVIPVLVLGLKSDRASDQVNALWIICETLEHGTPSQRDKIMAGEGTAIYSISLRRLASPEEEVRALAVKTIAWMFDKERARVQLWNPAIIPAITELAKITDDASQLNSVGKIAFTFCNGPDMPPYPHSLDTVRKVVHLFAILGRKVKDGQIITSLGLLMFVEGYEKVILSGGVLPFVVEHLTHSTSVIRSGAMHIISSVTKTESQMLQFFKALNGTEGIDGFYEFSRNSKMFAPDSGVEVMDNKGLLVQFLQTLDNALSGGDGKLQTQLSDVVLDSGFVVPLVKFLEERRTPEPFPGLALSILKAIKRNGNPVAVSKAKIGEALRRGRTEL